jgi:hypothetical protein
MKALTVYVKRSFRISFVSSIVVALIYGALYLIFNELPYSDASDLTRLGGSNSVLPSFLISRSWWDLLFVYLYVPIFVGCSVLYNRFIRIYESLKDEDYYKASFYLHYPLNTVFFFHMTCLLCSAFYLVLKRGENVTFLSDRELIAITCTLFLVSYIIFGVYIYFKKKDYVLLRISFSSVLGSLIMSLGVLASSVFSAILSFAWFFLILFLTLWLGFLIGAIFKITFKLFKKTGFIFKRTTWEKMYNWIVVG